MTRHELGGAGANGRCDLRLGALPRVAGGAPHYESFYLKACRPGGGLGLWLRYTVLKPPGQAPQGARAVALARTPNWNS